MGLYVLGLENATNQEDANYLLPLFDLKILVVDSCSCSHSNIGQQPESRHFCWHQRMPNVAW